MTILALLGGLLAAIVFVAERIAFAVMLYIGIMSAYRFVNPHWKSLRRHLRVVRMSFDRWIVAWVLKRRFAVAMP